MPPETRAPDRRVVRSRAALFEAAVRLVAERGTTAIPITELAEAAGVSRQLVYLHFANRDALLVGAAVELARRELLTGADSALMAAVEHFAGHRAFYRAMLSGSCAFEFTRALGDLLAPVNRQLITTADVDPATLDDLAVFITGGMGSIINAWLLDDEEPDPARFAERLQRLWRGLGLKR